MAFSSTAAWEVRTAGADTNGGCFDPGVTGMTADLAATVATGNSPVVTSATYTFVAGDVGAFLYIKSGTNWLPGWYPIASVAGGAATLSASVGAALQTSGAITAVAGCASTASPTAGTWSVDYSQQNGAKVAYTDIVIGGTTTQGTSVATPFTANMVGNSINITSGTGFTVQRVAMNSVAAGVATFDKSLGTTLSTGGTGSLGGAVASPGLVAPLLVGGGSNKVFQKSGAYSITSTTSGNSNSIVAYSASQVFWFGYGTARGDYTSATPVLTASGIATTTLWNNTSTGTIGTTRNIKLDGASLTSIKGFAHPNANYVYQSCTAVNCTNLGFNVRNCIDCFASGCNNGFDLASNPVAVRCVATACTSVGFNVTGGSCMLVDCISYANTSHGFQGANEKTLVNCVSYGNGGSGFSFAGASVDVFYNCVAVNNAAFGWTTDAVRLDWVLQSCAAYNNTSGPYNTTNIFFVPGLIALSGSPFTNGGSGDFSLNNTAGAGASLRGTAWPATYPGGLTANYRDIGAAQHQDSGSGTTTYIYNVME